MRTQPTSEFAGPSELSKPIFILLSAKSKEKFPSPGTVQAPARIALLPELWPTFPITFLQGVPNA